MYLINICIADLVIKFMYICTFGNKICPCLFPFDINRNRNASTDSVTDRHIDGVKSPLPSPPPLGEGDKIL